MVTAPAAEPALEPARDQQTPIRVSLTRGPAALELLDDRWDDLLRRQPIPNPLLSATWLRAVARWDVGVPLVLLGECDGRLVAGAAVGLRRRGRGLGPSLATWLGPENLLSYLDILSDPQRPQAGEAVVAALLDEVDALSVRSPASGAMTQALAALAPWRRETAAFERWLLPCPPPRLEYVRRRVARDLRRADRLGARIDVRVHRDPADVIPALARFFRLYRERWRDRPDEIARFASSHALRRWNMETVSALAADGHVVLVEVTEDGRTVACQLTLVHGGGAIGRVTAVRPGGLLDGPGHLALLAGVEHAVATGTAVIDLGRGTDGPGGSKLRLGPYPDPLLDVFAASTPALQRRYEVLRRIRRSALVKGAIDRR